MLRSPNGLLHVIDVLLECKFRRMHADHHQALVLVFLRPGANIRNRAQAVDAGIGPEIDQHDLALQILRRQRRRVQPFGRAVERRQIGLRPASAWSSPDALSSPAGLGAHHRRAATASSPNCRADAICQAGPVPATVVLPTERLVRKPVSRPSAIATTAASTAAPRPAPDPLTGTERTLHRSEHPSADEQAPAPARSPRPRHRPEATARS